MAQSKVTEYFSSRKRNSEFQPFKRRKVQRTSTIQDEISDFSDGSISASSTVSTSSKNIVLASTTTKKRSARIKGRSSSTRKAKIVGPIERTVRRLRSSACETEDCSSSSDLDLRVSDSDSASFTSESTAVVDDHDVRISPPGTPTKRSKASTDVPISRKRRKPSTRTLSQSSFDYFEEAVVPTPAEFGFELTGTKQNKNDIKERRTIRKVSPPKEAAAKKKLELKLKPKICEEEIVQEKVVTNQDRTRKKTERSSGEPSSVLLTPKKIKSPVSMAAAVRAGKVPTISDKTMSPKLTPIKDGSSSTLSINKSPGFGTPVRDKVRTLKGKLSPASIKEKLSKVSSLSELQARLAKVKENTDKGKKSTTRLVEKDVETKESKMPAYQKYHSLAAPVPPSLTLPYKYKLVEEMFRSVDTIVSLLRNRSEVCTFAKLKGAVQEMVRKTFEQKNLGQIKTVYPSAYVFRQEKGIPYSRNGLKCSDYQLTIDANVESESSEKSRGEKSHKLTSGKLIERKNIFHHRLVDIVKYHHANFLSTLTPPMSVPSDKITRWHPKFPVDQVPDVEPAPLPEAPNIMKYTTAKDVLDKARDMLTPRVEQALENVARKSQLEESAKTEKVEPSPAQTPQKPTNSMKGVPQSLLERIRAKEAKKLAASMVRDPAEDKKTDQMERLPELCRILRGFFLSEKKAALPYDLACQKLAESYKSCISTAQVEEHIKLMAEFLPEWLSIVHIRKSTYLKIDKNKDMNSLANKMNQLVKQRK
ncbi:DNA replication factor Cdt1-like [Glandiceps talaboti]